MSDDSLEEWSIAMSPTLQRLGIDKMTVEERMELVFDIMETIPAEQSIPDWHVKLINERLADVEANPGVGSSWADVKARLLKQRKASA